MADTSKGTDGKESTLPGKNFENERMVCNTNALGGPYTEHDAHYGDEPTMYTHSYTLGEYNASNLSVVPTVRTKSGVDAEKVVYGPLDPIGVGCRPESKGIHRGAIAVDDHVYYLRETEAMSEVVTKTGHKCARVAY